MRVGDKLEEEEDGGEEHPGIMGGGGRGADKSRFQIPSRVILGLVPRTQNAGARKHAIDTSVSF